MKKIWETILGFFGTLKSWFAKFQPQAKIAVEVVNKVKAAVEVGYLDTITDLIPGDADAALLSKIRKALEKAAPEILAGENIINAEKPVAALIDYLKTKQKDGRGKFYTELAGRLVEYLADGRLTLPEAIALGQLVFSKIF